MINVKLYEELQGKRTELDAGVRVCQTIWEFIIANADRCKSERNFSECQAWIDALDKVNTQLKILDDEYSQLVEQIKEV